MVDKGFPAVTSLAYIGYNATDPGAWRGFLDDIFAMERRADSPAERDDYRIDQCHHRISVHAAGADSLAYLGWAMESRSALAEFELHLTNHGVSFERGSRELAETRAVLELVVFIDPDGIRHEACFGLGLDSAAYLPTRPRHGYLTGDMGLGHVGLMVRDHVTAAEWYMRIFGFRLTDVVEVGMLRGTFMHCNGRHHSLAVLSEIPGMFPAGTIQHMMLEATSLEDVGRGYDTLLQKGYPIGLTLGQHANDEMVSFYAWTPSRCQIEYGFGGRIVDPATWVQKYYNSGDWWGHEMRMPPEKWPFASA